MTSKRLPFVFCLLAFVITGLVVGCSSDDKSTTPTGGGGTDVQFTEFTGLVEAIAPPVYALPIGSPMFAPDSIWTEGSYPLLGKVFGEDEPMSLYWNTSNLDDAIEILTEVVQQLADLGIEGDTSFTTGGSTIQVMTPAGLTTIPTECQGIFGFSSIDIDKVYKMVFTDGDFTNTYHLGYTSTDSTETYLTYYSTPAAEGDTAESFLYHAFVNLTDSSIEIEGVFFKDYGNQTSARWGYAIQTVDDADFAYRMSWYADDMGETSGLGCIIGGGNKDVEFALKYRQYTPADAQDTDSLYRLDQMFDGDYGYVGTGIATGYEDFVDEQDIYTLEYMPTALISSPWAID